MPNLTGFGNLSGFYEVIFLNVYSKSIHSQLIRTVRINPCCLTNRIAKLDLDDIPTTIC